MKISNFALCSASLLLWSCDANDATPDIEEPQNVYDATVPSPKNVAESGSPVPISNVRTPQAFVNTVAASNLFEITAARKALDHAGKDSIRTFANNLIEEHEKAQAELETAVNAADRELEFSPELDPAQQANLDILDQAGDDFDTVYLQQQNAAHSDSLSLLNDYAARGDIPSLREHAEAAAMTVSKHLKKVTELQARAD